MHTDGGDVSVTLGERREWADTHRVEALSLPGVAKECDVNVIHRDDLHREVMVSVERTTPAGHTIHIGKMVIAQRGDRAHLWHLFVVDDHRGRGIGSALFRAFRQYARQAPSVERLSGRLGNPDGRVPGFLRAHGVPAAEVDTGRDHVHDKSVCAFGAGSADPLLEEAVALDEFDGFNLDALTDDSTPEDTPVPE